MTSRLKGTGSKVNEGRDFLREEERNGETSEGRNNMKAREGRRRPDGGDDGREERRVRKEMEERHSLD